MDDRVHKLAWTWINYSHYGHLDGSCGTISQQEDRLPGLPLTEQQLAEHWSEPVNEQAEHLDEVAITSVTITPVAFKDPPLLNTVGVHEPYALRAIVEVHTDSGISGVGETYGDAGHLARLEAAAARLPGTDVFNINEFRSRIAAALQHDTVRGGHGMSGMVTGSSTTDRVLSAFDVA